MDKLATKQQLAHIVQMFASDQLPFDATQKFISAHSKKRGKRSKRVDRNLAYWEEQFPGCGQEIMNVLRPFYGWQPALRRAIPRLEKRARSAVFWKEVKSVHINRLESVWDLNYAREDTVAESLEKSIRHTLGDSISYSLEEALDDSIGPSLRNSVRDVISESIGVKIIDFHSRNYFNDSIGESLMKSIFYACVRVVEDRCKEGAKFKPLLDLYLAGNFPAGFDKEGDLLVLVAD